MAKKPKSIPGLYLRPSGTYEKSVLINGKRKTFYSTNPADIYKKIALYQDCNVKGPLFADVAEKWRAEHLETLSPTTQRGYNAAYNRAITWFGGTHIRDIAAVDIKRKLQDAGRKYAYKTASNQLSVLRTIFSFACEESIIDENPAYHVKVPTGLPRQPRRFPSDEELASVKQNIDKTFGLFMFFILYTGCRRGEALGLQWKHIDFEKKEIHVRQALCFTPKPLLKTTKTAAGCRDVILLDRLAVILKPFKGKPDEFIFYDGDNFFTEMRIHKKIEKYHNETGLKVNPHELRHGFATMLFEAGIDEKTAQYFLGHAQISTTMDVYTHLREIKKRKAAEMLNDYDFNV